MRTIILFTLVSLISAQESCKKLPVTPRGKCASLKDCPPLQSLIQQLPISEAVALAGDCNKKNGKLRVCCPLTNSIVSDGSSGIALVNGAPGYQCSSISITSEGIGAYEGHFSATASSSFVGLTVEFTFDNIVDSLEFSAGTVQLIDSTRYRLVSSGWEAQPGWGIEFDFVAHFSGSKPEVVGVVMNDIALCELPDLTPANSQQCGAISIIHEGSGTYNAQFSAVAKSSFTGLTVDLMFDNNVDSLDFTSGLVRRIDSTHFKLVSSGWKAQPGWGIDFDFTPHFSGPKPIVIGVIMNDVQICGVSNNVGFDIRT